MSDRKQARKACADRCLSALGSKDGKVISKHNEEEKAGKCSNKNPGLDEVNEDTSINKQL